MYNYCSVANETMMFASTLRAVHPSMTLLCDVLSLQTHKTLPRRSQSLLWTSAPFDSLALSCRVLKFTEKATGVS